MNNVWFTVLDAFISDDSKEAEKNYATFEEFPVRKAMPYSSGLSLSFVNPNLCLFFSQGYSRDTSNQLSHVPDESLDTM